MGNKYLGSCLCEQVQYEVEGNFESFFLCHCKYCQKDSGSAHTANLFSTSAKLNWIVGKEVVTTFNLPSTRHTKSFCRFCGSAVPYELANNLLVFPAGGLNTEISIIPNAHVFFASRASWDEGLEKLKRFDQFPV